jgi:thiamine biosynthesis protein ThiS
VKILLNGEPHEIPGRLSVASLLTSLGIDPRRVAVEHNLAVVKRSAFDGAMIEDGDSIEIVNFVGGGA